MDLKELYLRQRVAVASAAAASSPEAKSSHRQQAAGYADRINNYDASSEERQAIAHPLQSKNVDDDASSLRELPQSDASSQ